MEQTKLMCQLQVLPFQPHGPEGEDAEGKQLVFTDNDTGKIIIYPMSAQFAESVMRKLKMKNKALQDDLEREAQAAQARARIIGSNGPPDAQEQEAMRQILGPDGGPVGKPDN